jgi:hypothetical protein
MCEIRTGQQVAQLNDSYKMMTMMMMMMDIADLSSRFSW